MLALARRTARPRMAHYHSRTLTDALRELSREPVDYSEVVEDSEPERVAAEDARKRARAAQFAHSPVPWDWPERDAEQRNASKQPDAGLPRTQPPTPDKSESILLHEVIDVDDDDEICGSLRKNMLKFKHTATSVSSKRTSATPAPSFAASRSASPSTDNWLFSNAQYGQIHTCIGCEARWTSRKTVPQKLTHMRSCARKRGLSDDTVRTLLQRQLDEINSGKTSLPATSTARKLGPSAQPPPTTYLETIVNDSEGKKRGKKPVITSAILPAAKARDNILAKADDVLGGSVLKDDGLLGLVEPQCEHFADNHPPRALTSSSRHGLQPDENIPSTQALPASRLLVGTRTSSSLFPRKASLASEHDEDDEEQIPATQALPTSRLAASLPPARSIHTSTALGASPRSPRSPVSVIEISSSEPSPTSSRGRPKSRASQRAVSLSSSDEDDPWEKDDAIFEGGATLDGEDLGGVRRYSSALPPPARRYSELLSTDEASEPENAPHPTPTALPSPKSPKKRGRPKKTAPMQNSASTVHVAPIDFNSAMKDCIIRDNQLYLRILRYEPIHFDVFAKLALDQGFEKRTLLAKLRNFLDEEGINFHTNDPGASSSRRRRR